MYDLARLDITMPVTRAARLAFALASLAVIFALLALTAAFGLNRPEALIAGHDVVWLIAILAFCVGLAMCALLACFYALVVMWARGYRGFGRVLFAIILILGFAAYPSLLLTRWHSGDKTGLNTATPNFTAKSFELSFQDRQLKFLPALPQSIESLLFQPVFQIAGSAIQTPSFEHFGDPILMPLAIDEAFDVVQQSLQAKGYWIMRATPPAKPAPQKGVVASRTASAQRKAGNNSSATVPAASSQSSFDQTFLGQSPLGQSPLGQNQTGEIEASVLSPLLLFRDMALVRLTGHGQSTEVNIAFIPRFAWSDFGAAHRRLDALRDEIKAKVEEQ